MKELNMLVWLTQLGVSVAVPLGGFTLLGLYLKNRFSLGAWVVIAGCALGLYCAVSALRYNLKLMAQMDRKNDDQQPPISFNDHH